LNRLESYIVDSKEEVIRKLNVWREDFENKGSRVIISETKLMVGEKECNTKKTAWKWPCAICGKNMDSTSMQYNKSTTGA